MDENKVVFDTDLNEEDCIRLSLDDELPEGFDELWDDTDEEELEICASKKRCDKKKCIIIAAIAGLAIAITAVVIYKLLKNRNKNK
ncbi:MAG: hypothetical protein IJC49_07085 [Clostridia bacterium]|nr:hypothetical protein [Clostridia bacterium]